MYPVDPMAGKADSLKMNPVFDGGAGGGGGSRYMPSQEEERKPDSGSKETPPAYDPWEQDQISLSGTASNILITDDEELVLESLRRVLTRKGYDVTTARTGDEAVALAKEKKFDLVICDVRMPGKDGIETLREMKEMDPALRSMVITGYASPETPDAATRIGVNSYLSKPFDLEDFLGEIGNILSRARGLKEEAGTVADDRTLESLKRLASSFEKRNPWFDGHTERLRGLAVQIGRKLKLPPTRIRTIELAAALHDIGQLEIPDSLFLKSDSLLSEEHDLIKQHVVMAKEILDAYPGLEAVTQVILKHHERIDGHGYPQGLQGDNISREAQVLGIAENFIALTSDRPHREAMECQEAILILSKDRGHYFTEVLQALVEVVIP
ncbi:MAG: response regulator [Armatimonadetes bacterium]|nr:response regulator [Armatimonadota bacterium]